MTSNLTPKKSKSQIYELKKEIQRLKHAERLNDCLFNIANAVNTTVNLDELYAFIHQSLNRLVHMPNFFIAIYEKENGIYSFPYFMDEVDKFDHVDNRQFKTKSLTREVILKKKPLFLNKKMLEKRASDRAIMGTVPKAWIGVPLILGKVVIGILAVQSYEDEHAFDKADMEILISASNQIAVAIERKRINEALVESEARYRVLAEKSHDIIMRFDRDCRFLYANHAVKQVGFKPDQAMGKKLSDFRFPKNLIGQWEKAIQTVIQIRDVHRIEFKLPEGSWVDWLLCPEFSNDGEVASVLTFARDITLRKQTEFHNQCLDRINKIIIKAQDMENMLDNILLAMLDIFDCDRSWLLSDVDSDAYVVTYMKSKPKWNVQVPMTIKVTDEVRKITREILGSEKPCIFHPKSNQKVRIQMQDRFGVKTEIATAVFPKLSKPWVAGMHQCTRDRDWSRQEIHLFEDICRRISDGLGNMLLYRELQQAKNYIDNVIDSMPSILIGVDIDAKITQWNFKAQMETKVAAHDAQGKYFYDFFPHLKEFTGMIKKAIDDQRVMRKTRIRRTSNKKTTFDNITVYPLMGYGEKGVVIRIDDVTEQLQVEEMMIQSEKMLSVGGLAAGMAHEINNPLAGMMQNAQVIENRLLKDLPDNEKAASELGISMNVIKKYIEKRQIKSQFESINEAGIRAAEIVKNMLSFARKGDSAKTYSDLPQLFDKTVELARSDYDLKQHFDFKAVVIKVNCSSDFPLVFCEPSKIQQVFFNIIKNGTEAMYGLKKGHSKNARFEVSFISLDKEVKIEIANNGPGMEEDVKRRAFEPFFTTKGPDKGTGLGLSVAYFIITDDHDGQMSVVSAPDKGTKFVIQLPVGNIK
ncbi:MAG: PAS domain S-box protein [Desulfobacteraceae bacterium]|nr:PAS domain S-box protein [Desulfobacteraceae bacterium]